MAIYRLTSKLIISIDSQTLLNRNSAWICRGFVSATAPSHKSKVDKETCSKVIEAAETVKDGTKEVVNEVKRIGKAVTDKVVNTTGNVVADVAKKRFEQASENAETERGKDLSDTGKAAAEAIKERVDRK